MNESIKVSVIVPVYNVEKFLPQCLDTILAQDHKNIEVILVDDGATDSSGLIIDRYAEGDSRIVAIHKTNEGVSIARNTGLEVVTGEYVCFVDADDYLMPNYVSYLLALVVENQVPISLTTSMLSTFTSTLTNVNLYDEGKTETITGYDATKMILYYHIPIGCYCKLFKSSFLHENNIKFIDGLIVGEGFNFNTTAFQYADKVVVGHRKVYCYRRDNPNSCMTSFNLKKSIVALEAISIIRENLLVYSPEMLRACNFAHWHTAADMYNWMVLAGAKEQYADICDSHCKYVKSWAWQAFHSPINRKEKFRALLQCVHPRLLVYLLEFRRWVNRRTFDGKN